MKKITYSVSVILILTLFAYCTNSTSESKPNYKSEIARIENLLVPNYKGKLTFKVDSLDGGLAIMSYTSGTPQAAFWIKDNTVYAANGTAMAWTRSTIEYTPIGIDFDSVLKVVED